ncbi:MAG: flavocytochrome c [Gammaproteobacteria bacterium]|nr:MAG: flavocytochrome c [Gammaproteobacteria bacterium]
MTRQDKSQHRMSVSRRGLLQAGAAFAAGAGALAVPTAATSAGVPESWDESYDVVVIGSGFAGLSAAYEARKAGASVALFEKMPSRGGNSVISGGFWSVAGTPLQEEQGIEDSPESLLEDMLAAGLDMNHVELARKVAFESLDALMWSIEEIGVEYRDNLVHLGGHSVARSYYTDAGDGSGLTRPLMERLRENGVEPRTRVALQHLLRDADGRVKGVAVREGVPFPDDGSGEIRHIKAGKAVVLAAGGFGNDVAFRMLQDPRLEDGFSSTNQPGSTAEALREALKIGCTPIQLSWIQLLPPLSPDERGFGLGFDFGVMTTVHGIWINTLTGERFVNEIADRKTRADAMLRVGDETIAIADADGAERIEAELMEQLLEREVVMRFDTLEELANAHDVPLDALEETISNWNAAVEAGEDAQWGRAMQRDQTSLDTPPWYAMRLTPKIHHTMGGVGINTEAQALDVSTGEVIPGLYCAGEITGGVHGAVRLGGCAYGDAIVFGRIAGRNAADEEEWS